MSNLEKRISININNIKKAIKHTMSFFKRVGISIDIKEDSKFSIKDKVIYTNDKYTLFLTKKRSSQKSNNHYITMLHKGEARKYYNEESGSIEFVKHLLKAEFNDNINKKELSLHQSWSSNSSFVIDEYNLSCFRYILDYYENQVTF